MGQLRNLRFLSAAEISCTFCLVNLKIYIPLLTWIFLETHSKIVRNTFEQPKVLPVIHLQMPATLLESSATEHTIPLIGKPWKQHL